MYSCRELPFFCSLLICCLLAYWNWRQVDCGSVVVRDERRRVSVDRSGQRSSVAKRAGREMLAKAPNASWKHGQKEQALFANKPDHGGYVSVKIRRMAKKPLRRRPLDSNRTSGQTEPVRLSGMTIVTALLDIGRGEWNLYRRPYSMYLDFMRPLLGMNVNLFVFTDAVGARFVRKHRANMSHRTKVYEITLQQLPWFTELPRMRQIIADEQANWRPEWDPAMREHPECMSAEYDLLVNSKPYFVSTAAHQNPFRSEYFFWLDAGYGHGRVQYPPTGVEWAPLSIMTPTLSGRTTFIHLPRSNLNATFSEMYRQNYASVIGGFFGGDFVAVQRFYGWHANVFQDFLDNGYVDDDQIFMVICYQKQPGAYNLISGDWYEVFKLFPPPSKQ